MSRHLVYELPLINKATGDSNVRIDFGPKNVKKCQNGVTRHDHSRKRDVATLKTAIQAVLNCAYVRDRASSILGHVD